MGWDPSVPSLTRTRSMAPTRRLRRRFCMFGLCGRNSLPPTTPSPKNQTPKSAAMPPQFCASATTLARTGVEATVPGAVDELILSPECRRARTAPCTRVSSPADADGQAPPLRCLTRPWTAPGGGKSSRQEAVTYFSDSYFPSGEGRPRRPMPPALTMELCDGRQNRRKPLH